MIKLDLINETAVIYDLNYNMIYNFYSKNIELISNPTKSSRQIGIDKTTSIAKDRQISIGTSKCNMRRMHIQTLPGLGSVKDKGEHITFQHIHTFTRRRVMGIST